MSTVVVATVKSNTSDPPAFQNTSGTEIGRLCRAFVNFNGVGTVTINAQYNVSSITDNGIGDYTVNFATAFVDANYAACGLTFKDSSLGDGLRIAVSTAPTSSAIRHETFRTNDGALQDKPVHVAYFR